MDGDGVADANIFIDGVCALNCNIQKESTTVTEEEALLNVTTKAQTIVYMGSLKNVEAYAIKPGWSDTLEFSITNAGKENAYFKLDWLNVKNDITLENDVVYTLIKDDVVIKEGEKFPYEDTTILDKVLISPNTTYKYKVLLEFRDTGVDQSVDIDKAFSGSIKATIVE